MLLMLLLLWHFTSICRYIERHKGWMRTKPRLWFKFCSFCDCYPCNTLSRSFFFLLHFCEKRKSKLEEKEQLCMFRTISRWKEVITVETTRSTQSATDEYNLKMAITLSEIKRKYFLSSACSFFRFTHSFNSFNRLVNVFSKQT